MVRKHIITGVAAAIAFCLALGACGSSDKKASSSSAAKDTINTVLWYAPSNFNPATSASSPDYSVARLGFDTLLRNGEAKGSYVGGLATDWKANSTSSYTFTIRKGATCSDGTTITPTVIANSFEYLAKAKESGAQSWRKLAFGTGTPTFKADNNSNTLNINLSEPYSQLLGGVTLVGTGVICPAGLADTTGLAAGTVKGAFSGPYTLNNYKAGVSATYKLRNDYAAWPKWKNVTGNPAKTINITVEKDPNTSASLLQSGGLDMANFYDSNAKRFNTNGDYNTITDNSTANSLLFNEDSSSVFANNKELRAAVSQAVSAKAFNDAAGDGLGRILTSVADKQFSCVSTDKSLLQTYNPDIAAKTLKGKTIRLVSMTNWDSAVNYVSEALTSAGATVKTTTVPPSDLSTQLRTEPTTWDLTIRGEINSSGLINQSLQNYLGPSFTNGGTNYTSSNNPKGTELLTKALSSTDPNVQCKAFIDAQKSILERVDVAPLATSTHYIVSRKDVITHIFSGYWDLSATRITN